MTPDLPDALDILSWRAAIHGAGDRPAQQAVVRAWASALGCAFGEGEADGHLIQGHHGVPPAVAGALWHHAATTGLYLKPPPGGWPRNDRLPEWLPGR